MNLSITAMRGYRARRHPPRVGGMRLCWPTWSSGHSARRRDTAWRLWPPSKAGAALGRRMLPGLLFVCAMSLPALLAPAVDARVVSAFTMETGATRGSGSVADVNGAVVSTGLPVAPDDGTEMTFALKPRLGGVNTVAYASFPAAGGRAVNGSFNFTVAPGGASGTGAATSSGKGGGTPWALLVAVLAAVAAFIVGGFFIAVRSRREYLDMEARKAARPSDEDR